MFALVCGNLKENNKLVLTKIIKLHKVSATQVENNMCKSISIYMNKKSKN